MIANRLFHWLPALAFAGLAFTAYAATPQDRAAAPADALQTAHGAVVGLKIRTAEGASSAETLGRERSGTGVVIGPDELVLTIGYLILEADTIQVETSEGRTVPARAVAYDLATGFGLVRPLVPLRGVRPVPLGSVAALETGEQLMAVVGGDGGGVALTNVVGRRAFSGYWEYHIETALFTAPPLPNHSGAAVFNRRGELLGIGSLFVMDTTGTGQRLPGNMFVPVDLLKPILAELQQAGTSRQSRRAWIGVNAAEQDGRVRIVRVTKDSPAHGAGISPGDVVVAVDGVPVASLEAFYKKLWERANPDDEVRLTVLQGANTQQVTVRAKDRMSVMKRPSGI